MITRGGYFTTEFFVIPSSLKKYLVLFSIVVLLTFFLLNFGRPFRGRGIRNKFLGIYVLSNFCYFSCDDKHLKYQNSSVSYLPSSGVLEKNISIMPRNEWNH